MRQYYHDWELYIEDLTGECDYTIKAKCKKCGEIIDKENIKSLLDTNKNDLCEKELY